MNLKENVKPSVCITTPWNKYKYENNLLLTDWKTC